ncbi:uncharacterized protein PAN0_008d3633 [Moesziomyces antarcticus]|uniref:Uncharacterized protein n=2 Tax=Pseudozyma antarctica TaxID=84753 RepID=A0A5C3FPS8_PSEA2|nr:uncharacterized protein PAN0_008d3633 [Moesziomyces antarcticus]GAK65416.1 conserved hypothetical protein [Moesziomyces antarcticus]SPO46424.1 uncharacterized protein PSANT_04110 [Moesziomyces antarcticus]
MVQEALSSLRQRISQSTGINTARQEPEDPIRSHDGKPNSHAPPNSRRGIRLNRVLGRIVPIILLVYVANAYDLVVVRHAYRQVYLQQGRLLPLGLWLVPTHALFLWSLRAYLRVFFAHSQTPSRSHTNNQNGVLAWLRSGLGATFADPDPADTTISIASVVQGNDVTVELCSADGQPVRCWRDSCNGRIKTFRMRHCGDCATCRVGFDHHCAWFDNDVTAPSTLRPFISFLLSIPPLYALGFAPLFRPTWRSFCGLAASAASDAHIAEVWWGRWYSWVGGPVLRWIVALSLASRRRREQTPDAVRASVVIALGAVFVLIASALAASSLGSLRRGLLTVDVERAKAYARLQRQMQKLDAIREEKDALQKGLDSLGPTQHFRISWMDPDTGEARTEVVALSIDDGLLSHASTAANLRAFLMPSRSTSRPGWDLSEPAIRSLLTKATIPVHT